MKCIYCGAEIRKGQIYCPSCGKEVQLVSAQSVLEDDYLNDFLDENDRSKKRRKKSTKESNAGYDSELYARAEAKEAKEQQKKLVTVSICVMVFVLAVVAFLAWFLVYNSHANSLSYQLEQGTEAAESGEYEKAVKHYERVLKLSRNNVEARVALGQIYLEKKDYDSAQIMFQEAVNLDGKNIEAYRGLLQVFERQKQYSKITEIGAAITDPSILEALDDYLVDAPVFDHEGGEYDDTLTLTLSSEDGDTIYYTTDGKDPIQYGSIYREPFVYDSDGSYQVTAVCVNDKGVYSATIDQKYEINIAVPDMPVVNPSGGNFGALTYVSISVPDNCTAYYTWDGTDPNVTSKRYTRPFSIPAGANVLSVVIVDNRTGKVSEIFRNSYTYYE